MADNDAINEFAPEDPGQPRPADDLAADLPLHTPLDVFASSPPEIVASSMPDVEDRYFRDGNTAPVTEDARVPADEDPSSADDHSAYAEAYSNPDQFPAAIHSSARIQVVAALATIGLLGVMYAAFVQQRSAALMAIPSVPSRSAATTDSTDLASALSPVTDDTVTDDALTDNSAPQAPTYVPPPFDDPFGLTRGLSPSLPPPDNFDLRAAAPAATPDSASPAAASAAASAAVPAAPPSPAAASAANVAPPPATPSPTTPSPVTPSPVAAPPPPAAAAASPAPAPAPTPAPAASPASTTASAASVAAAIKPAAPPPVGAPPAAASPAAAAVIDSNRNGIQSTLARYRKAFSSLDASAVREVWPTVNERTLSRAFDRLEEQDVSFDRCQIEVANDRAEATCNGTARYVPRVGSRTPRVDSREWKFNLVKVKDQWLIGALDAR